CVQGIQLPLTF
nr:immunoglobulin light chain junction region [Macaca mulatta]MOW12496.1 immunoglobulin light chain junction region [Macaca mulatta]